MIARARKPTFWSIVDDWLPSRPESGTILVLETAELVEQIRMHDGFDYVDAGIVVGLLLAPPEHDAVLSWIVTPAGDDRLRFAAK